LFFNPRGSKATAWGENVTFFVNIIINNNTNTKQVANKRLIEKKVASLNF